MAIYLKIDGINGNATEDKHAKWIDCTNMDFQVVRAMQGKAGAANTRETGTPQVSEIKLVKRMDASSPHLFKMSVTGDTKKAEIHLVNTGSGNQYAEYKLENCIVSAYVDHVADEIPVETISLNFTKIEFKYTAFDEKNKPTGAQSSSYDLMKNVVG